MIIFNKKPQKLFIDRDNWHYGSRDITVSVSIKSSQEKLKLEWSVKEPFTRAQVTEINGPVHEDSCVEIFLSFDQKNYLNIEINPLGTVYCAFGSDRHNRSKAKPELIEMLKINAPFQKPFQGMMETWQLTVEIPIQFLQHFHREKLQQLTDTKFLFNLYKCGDKLPAPHYLSHFPVNTEKPDFHQIEYFSEALIR